MNRYYTTFEAARLLGVSLPTVVNWIKARRLKAHRTPGGHRRIAREDLATFMIRHGMPLPADLDDAAHARRKALVIAEPGPAREGAARQLAAAGYAVDQASPGFAAGAAAARFTPDVFVIHAPAADGGEVLRSLRTDRELGATPIVAVGHPDWLAPLREAGCAEVVAAPPADGALEGAVASALAPAGKRGADGGRSPTSTRTRRPPRRPLSD
ncbi:MULTISPECIES: excisionase family DNA-binding protein [Anaeromyxobacter]|uniref:excisionase family DNA-binding protein n=1 Tax=Anaeromyxobacter TaxID=161492 RepID=UPI001F55F41E|nr:MULTISPECIES: excisionase family DNA-binding protein [unclassified Anaeromyxobacter]